MFLDSWVLDWFVMLTIATVAVAVLAFLLDRSKNK